MTRDQEVMDILRKGGYVVTARKLGDGLLVTAPAVTLEPHKCPAYELLVTVTPQGVVLAEGGVNEVWCKDIPPYARRMVAALEIHAVCVGSGYDPDAVDWRHEDGSPAASLNAAWPFDDPDGLENALAELVLRARRGEDLATLDTLADGRGVREGFEVCKDYFEEGE